jgi:hypothetical protein
MRPEFHHGLLTGATVSTSCLQEVTMKPTCWAAAAIVAIAGASVAHASDMIGVYARVDKVVLEPSEGQAQRIQVWGVFALADPQDPNTYGAPARGYVYYALPSNAALARREWVDLQRVAGTDQIVGFGTRWSKSGKRVRVRKADERPELPDEYTMDIGLQKVSGRADYAPVRSINEFKP